MILNSYIKVTESVCVSASWGVAASNDYEYHIQPNIQVVTSYKRVEMFFCLVVFVCL